MNAVLMVLTSFICFAPGLSFQAKSTQPTADPLVVAAVAPVYPTMALSVKADGDVVVEVTINSAGDVTRASVIDGNEFLKAPSVEAARRWKFQPSESSVNRKVKLTFTYVGDYQATMPKAARTAVFLPPYKVEVSNRPGEMY